MYYFLLKMGDFPLPMWVYQRVSYTVGEYIDNFGVSASESLGFLLNLHFFCSQRQRTWEGPSTQPWSPMVPGRSAGSVSKQLWVLWDAAMDTPTGEESTKLLGFADFLPQLDTHSNSEEIQGTISSAGMLCNPPPPKEKSWNHFLRPESCKKACFRIFPFFATLLNWKGKSPHQFFATSYAWRFHSLLFCLGWLSFDRKVVPGNRIWQRPEIRRSCPWQKHPSIKIWVYVFITSRSAPWRDRV